ncbi:cellulose biosynthesis protein BcsC [Providencia sp. R33]|uniref:cellulose synthase complex outer membrane protein BcsC n=1 Tax=Providencia sp. R33 TaxID=2828763 RepID=UPI001C5A5BD1|nr:cellulose synthase complex outer membrane protein BcsC [Providencia sp. R33]QXX81577.1 cellulose biosynthesis protein BcsC [Providencia sp. R33]
MNKFATKLSILTVSVLLSSSLYASNSAQQNVLLQQIRNAEVAYRDDIVKDALFRLELIDANNPDYLFAKIRYAIRQGDAAQIEETSALLQKIAPNSQAYKEAKISQYLSTIEGSNLLQEARTAVKNDNDKLAVEIYDRLFNGVYPTIELEIEYLNAYFYLPNKKQETLSKLKMLYKDNPDNAHIIEALAKRYFYFGQRAEGFNLLATLSHKGTENEAIGANAWVKEVQSWPVSTDSLSYLERAQTVFPNAKSQQSQIATLLAEQRNQMKDPSFFSRAEAMRSLKSKENKIQRRALPLLLTALKNNPNDAQILGEIGLQYSENGQRQSAINYLSRALKTNPQHEDSEDWKRSLDNNRYWLQISLGDKDKEKNALESAKRAYQAALSLNPKGTQALIGLGDVAVLEKNNEKAEKYYLSALNQEKNNLNAMEGLTLYYLQQSPEKAFQYLESLSASQKKTLHSQGRYLYSKTLDALATEAEQQQNTLRLIDVRQKIASYDPNNKWNIYHLAKGYHAQNNDLLAEKTIQLLNAPALRGADSHYIQALYYSSIGHAKKALALLDELPQNQWNKETVALYQQLKFTDAYNNAIALKHAGKEREATLQLENLPDTEQTKLPKRLLLSDWHLDAHQYALALEGYQQVLLQDPENKLALIGELHSLQGLNQTQALSEKLQRFNDLRQLNTYSVYSQRNIANIFAQLGENAQAERILQSLVESQSPLSDEERALMLRDLARIQQQQGHIRFALDNYAKGMVSAGITDELPKNREQLTWLTKHNAEDGWLKSSLRSDVAKLAKQDDIRVTLAYDYWGSNGKSGYSKLRAQTTMLQADMPAYDGGLFFRLDNVNLNAGKLKGSDTEKFGVCDDFECDSFKKQQYNGNSLALGWKNDRFNWDIGTTPLGFEVTDWVGGFEYNNQLGDINWALNAHRRPLTNSLLSFGGQKDPLSRIIWGGVRKTGVSLSGSYDLGGNDGYWADITADQLTGKNVPDNQSVRWMGGYYYKVINEADRRVSVGLNNMLWHYQKDLSDYTLGQGGYYSPQQYISFGLPVTYRQRTENWSWEVSGSVSWSYSHTKNSRKYPISRFFDSNDAIEDKEYFRQADNKGSYSHGVGYTTNLLIERKITPHWFVGASVDIQQAKDYTPSHALIYLRYSFDGWSGDLDMPPQPLIPYADFK